VATSAEVVRVVLEVPPAAVDELFVVISPAIRRTGELVKPSSISSTALGSRHSRPGTRQEAREPHPRATAGRGRSGPDHHSAAGWMTWAPLSLAAIGVEFDSCCQLRRSSGRRGTPQWLMFFDPESRELLRTRPSPLTWDQACRLCGARPAGPAPAALGRAGHRPAGGQIPA
jgi:hypothetical protein